MTDKLSRLIAFIDGGGLSRRGFLQTGAAFGAVAAVGTSMFGSYAYAGEPKQGGVLKLGMGGGQTTDTLDPALATNPVSGMLPRLWGDTVVAITPDKKVELLLLDKIEGNADGSEWVMSVKKGVKFHDGSEMTAADVVATFKRHSDENAKSGALGVMKGIKEIKQDGDNITLTMTGPNADLPYLLADYHLAIQPKGGVDKPAAAIGTGPYKLVKEEAGVRYVFEKHKEDWDTKRGHFDGAEIIVINDSTARNSALQSGQVHAINRVEPKVAKLLSKAPGVKVTQVSGPGHYVFIMHCDTAPFDNNDLRLALKYSINRAEMVDKILDGFGSVGNDIPINKSYPLFDEKLEQRPFDLAKATEHYKKSGHDGSPIELLVADGAFPGAVDAATLWQASCRKAGIPLTVKKVPDDGYWSDVWNVKPFCASYWGGRPVQDQMYSTAYLSTADWNDTRFKNEEFDKLVIEARAETDQAKRKDLYAKIATILWENGGVIVPMFNDFIDAHSDKLDGWIEDPNFELIGGYIASRTWFA